MSDPIEDIVDYVHLQGLKGDPYGRKKTAKQIRQQIGIELIEKSFQDLSPTFIVTVDQIREVCKLEGK